MPLAKYVQVKQLLLDGIRTERWGIGQRIPSLQQLVDASGASGATCKKAVVALMHDGILEGRQGKGVFVRSAAGRSDARQITLVAWSNESVSHHPAFVSTIQGLVEVMAVSSCQLNFCFLDPLRLNEAEMQFRLQQIHGCGVLITHTPHAVQQALAPLKAKNVPIVSIGRQMESLTPYAVINDIAQELDARVRAILDGGIRRLALLGCPREDVFRRWRLPAFERAYAQAGRSIRELIVQRGPATREDGRRLMAELLDRAQPPEVVFADDDYAAHGALQAIQERNLRLPQDIQLLGIGGFLDSSPSGSKVSALVLPHSQCARMAATMMLQLIEGHHVAQPLLIAPCALVDHGTFRTLSAVSN